MSWKLVRDHVRDWSEAHGMSGTYRQAAEGEYLHMLQRKLTEELGEYYERFTPDELYDLRDVLDTLIPVADPDKKAWQRHQEKIEKLGMFRDRILWNPVPQQYLKDEIT
jgi:predicted house-cleaning noncanonical NTP pyrophosphatase (MazG superfamily)